MTAENESCPIEYLLPSRATTEGAENQFSSVRGRSGEGNPGPLKTKQTLRVSAITQSVSPPRGANYGATCDETALTLLDISVSETDTPADNRLPDFPDDECDWPQLDDHTVVTEQGNNYFITKQNDRTFLIKVDFLNHKYHNQILLKIKFFMKY